MVVGLPRGWEVWHDSGVRSRFAGILAVLFLCCAACDSGGHATPSSDSPVASSPPTTASATPTRTGPLTTGPGVRPGEKPPVLGDGAKQHTSAGALAFGSFYFKAYDWGIATTDPYLVKQMSAPGCNSCKRYISGLDDLRRAKTYVNGGRIAIESNDLVTGSFRFKSDYVVAVVISEEALVEVPPSGAPTTTAPMTTHDKSFVFVSWVGRGWRVVEVGAPS